MPTDDLDVNPAAEASHRDYEPTPVVRAEHSEGQIARLIEQQSAKVPSEVFLFAAFAAMGLSAAFEAAGDSRMSRFVGMWPPTILLMGIYNKFVKELGVR